jgi:hypothetical protein
MQVSVRDTPVELTAWTVIALLVGLALIGYGAYDYTQQSAAIEDAVTVDATVLDTSISKAGARSIEYDVTIEYRYEYRGSTYESDDLFPGSLSPLYENREKAESVRSQYETGSTVTAYVDPDSPGDAFLRRQTTSGPPLFAGFGAFVLLVTALDAIGARTPGQDTELLPADEHEPTRYETLLGFDRDTVHRASKRLIAGSIAAAVLSLLGAIGVVFAAYGANGGERVELSPAVTDPLGLLFVVAFLAVLVLLGAILLYAIWSFTEYRRLRERIPDPRPPSPFRHPTRLVTIASTNDGLDEYGRRVKRTAFAVVVALFFGGALLELLVL